MGVHPLGVRSFGATAMHRHLRRFQIHSSVKSLLVSVNNPHSYSFSAIPGRLTLCAIPLPDGYGQKDPDYKTDFYPEYAPAYYIKLLTAETHTSVERAADTIYNDLRSSEDPDLKLAVRPHKIRLSTYRFVMRHLNVRL